MPKVNNKESLNVLVAGNGKNLDYISSSRFLKKLYTTSDIKRNGIINVQFNTFRELAHKCKALQIDLVIIEEEKWILEGIGDVFKKNYINCIAPTSKWTNLKLSNIYARNLLEKYNINVPPTTLLPADFPLIIKANGILKKANSIEDVIKIRQDVSQKSPEIAKSLYMEKFLDGEKFILISLFDGKHLLTFPNKNIDSQIIDQYTNKLENMLISEKADFIGFINSEIILYDDKLYNTGFCFEFMNPNIDTDILYILWLSIYQKLSELKF